MERLRSPCTYTHTHKQLQINICTHIHTLICRVGSSLNGFLSYQAQWSVATNVILLQSYFTYVLSMVKNIEGKLKGKYERSSFSQTGRICSFYSGCHVRKRYQWVSQSFAEAKPRWRLTRAFTFQPLLDDLFQTLLHIFREVHFNGFNFLMWQS